MRCDLVQVGNKRVNHLLLRLFCFTVKKTSVFSLM